MTALKTISMYLRAAKTEAEEAGIATDGMANSVSELRNEVLSLTGQKVDIMIDENTFKSTYQILEELSEVWSKLTDVTKANLGEMLGGKRNSNILFSILQNFDDAREAMETAMNSMGSAAEENEKYLDSIAGKMTQLKASFEAFSNSVLDSGIVKAFIDIAKGITDALTGLAKVNLLLPAIVSVITLIKGARNGISTRGMLNDLFFGLRAGQDPSYIIENAARALMSMNSSQQEFVRGQMNAARQAGALTAEMQYQIVEMAGLVGTTNEAAASVSFLGSMWKGMTKIFNTPLGFIGLLTAIVSATSAIINKIKRDTQESIDRAQELVDKYDEAGNTYKASIGSLKNLGARYGELTSKINENAENLGLTNEEYKEYRSIIDQIVDISPGVVKAYDAQGNAIVNYKTVLQEAIDKQNEYIETQRNIYLSGADDFFKGKGNELKQLYKAAGDVGNQINNAIVADFWFGTKHIKEFTKAFEEVGIEIPSDGIGGRNWQNLGTLAEERMSALMELYEKQEAFMAVLRRDGTYTSDELTEIEKKIIGLADVYTKFNEAQRQGITYLSEWAKTQSFYEDIPIGALDEFSNGLSNILDLSKSSSENYAMTAGYAKAFLGALSDEGLSDAYTQLQNGALSAEEYSEKIDVLTESWDMQNPAIAMAIAYYKSLVPEIEEAGEAADGASTEVNALTDSIKRMTDSQSILDKARGEMMSDGSISTDTLQSIIGMLDEEERLTDYIYRQNGAIMLNTEAWKKRGIAMLKSDSEGYQATIDTQTELLNQAEERLKKLDAEIAERPGRNPDAYGPPNILNPFYYMSDEELEAEQKSLENTVAKYKDAIAYATDMKEITDELIAQSESAGGKIDLSNMFAGIDDVRDNAETVHNALEKIKNGAELTYEEMSELAQNNPELLGNIFGMDMEAQANALQAAEDAYMARFRSIIEAQENEINSMIEGLDPEKEAELYQTLSGMLVTLAALKEYSLDDLLASDSGTKSNGLSDKISEITKVKDLLDDVRKYEGGEGDILSLLKDLQNFADASGVSIGNLIEIAEDGSITIKSTKIEEYIGSLFDGLKALKDEAGNQIFSDELVESLKSAALAAEETAEAFISLSDAIDGITSVSSFMTDIQSGEKNMLEQLESAQKFVDDYNKATGKEYSLTNLITGFDASTNTIQWNTDAMRELSREMLLCADGMGELESACPGITEAMMSFAAAEKAATKSTRDIQSSLMEAITTANKQGRYTEISAKTLQELIDVDKRYAQAVQIVNGRLTLNRDRFNEVTGSIADTIIAQAQAQANAIAMSDEYLDLASRIGKLNADEQNRLDGLNAEIMMYAALASELENATSAYAKFANASDDDSSSRYAQAVKALGVITDTIEKQDSEIFGKIGRDQFKYAVDFVLGENVEVNTKEFDNGLKLVKRYLTDDAEGVSNFYDDLVTNGIIDATTGAFNTTIGEISSVLGISTEAARALMEELELYQDTEFDWSKLDPGTEAQEAKTEIDTLTEALDAINTKQNEITNTPMSLSVEGATSAAGKVASALDTIITKLKSIAGLSNVNIKFNTSTAGTATASGGFLSSLSNSLRNLFSGSSSGQSGAAGINGARGGRTLVGELGREIVVDTGTGRWYTVGNRGPEFVNLPKGALVLNAAQTASVFRAGRTPVNSESGESMAIGTNMRSVAVNAMDGAASKASKNLAETAKNFASGVVSAVGGFLGNLFGSKTDVSGTAAKKPTSTAKKISGGGGSAKEVASLKEQYEELNEQLEHLIEHQQFLYKVAERGLDYNGMEASLREQARLYKEMMDNSYKAVDEMRAQGKDDTDKDLQDMERAAWAAYENMYDAFDKIRALYTDALHGKIDDVQQGYDNLKKALDELTQSGGLSVDTFQALAEHGLQYLSFLQNQDGQYEINEEAVRALIEAEKEQLAVETAISYLDSIREALQDGQANRVDALVDATQQIGDNTWNTVYAQAALLKELGLSDEQYNQVLFNIEALRNMASSVISDLGKQQTDALNAQQDALDKILEFTEDLVKAEVEDRIEAIKDEIDAYKQIIDLKKESLKTTKDENDYEKSKAEKVEEIAKLQAKIDQLSLDDSRAARAERAKLIEELEEKQDELAEFQGDHAYDAQIDALDKMAEDYEEKRKPEIEALEESISSTEKIYQMALARIRSGWTSLYGDLITWNTEQGSVINQEITENWNLACQAVARYGSYLNALQQMRGLDVSGSTGLPKYHSGGTVSNAGSINDHEVMAVLEKGELVLDKQKKTGLYRIIDFQKTLSEKLGTAIGNFGFRRPDIQTAEMGTPVKDGVPAISQTSNFSPTINVELTTNGNVTDSDAKRYGEKIADVAIDKLYNAFTRRGVTGAHQTRLKQA